MHLQRSKTMVFVLIALGALIIAALLAAGYFAKSYYDLRANPEQLSEEETKRLTDKVGRLYQLPDEEPLTGEVKDKDKLRDQPFFKNAQNGDKLLIYKMAKLAIIYREEENKLVNVGPLALEDE